MLPISPIYSEHSQVPSFACLAIVSSLVGVSSAYITFPFAFFFFLFPSQAIVNFMTEKIRTTEEDMDGMKKHSTTTGHNICPRSYGIKCQGPVSKVCNKVSDNYLAYKS